jgi:hypothetical protein
MHILCGAAVLVAAGAMPIWDVWYWGPREGSAKKDNLYVMACQLPDSVFGAGSVASGLGVQMGNVTTLFICVLLIALCMEAAIWIEDTRRGRRGMAKRGFEVTPPR